MLWKIGQNAFQKGGSGQKHEMLNEISIRVTLVKYETGRWWGELMIALVRKWKQYKHVSGEVWGRYGRERAVASCIFCLYIWTFHSPNPRSWLIYNSSTIFQTHLIIIWIIVFPLLSTSSYTGLPAADQQWQDKTQPSLVQDLGHFIDQHYHPISLLTSTLRCNLTKPVAISFWARLFHSPGHSCILLPCPRIFFQCNYPSTPTLCLPFTYQIY